MTNEAAERLRSMWGMGPVRKELLDAALAAERRATVERIRGPLREIVDGPFGGGLLAWEEVDRVLLDAEAER
jgi:hypothetical protein